MSTTFAPDSGIPSLLILWGNNACTVCLYFPMINTENLGFHTYKMVILFWDLPSWDGKLLRTSKTHWVSQRLQTWQFWPKWTTQAALEGRWQTARGGTSYQEGTPIALPAGTPVGEGVKTFQCWVGRLGAGGEQSLSPLHMGREMEMRPFRVGAGSPALPAHCPFHSSHLAALIIYVVLLNRVKIEWPLWGQEERVSSAC